MKYALIQYKESNYVAESYGGKEHKGPVFTRLCFNLIGEFDTLEEAIKARGLFQNQDWYKIIQVW